MQQFTVPQFIDVETKIIGPITTRQFLIFLGVGIFIAAAYRLFDFTLFLTISIPVALISMVFAFFRVNGRPFHYFVLNILQTWRRPGIRVWNSKDQPETVEMKSYTFNEKIPSKEFYHRSRLAELSLVVDTAGEYRGAWEEDNELIEESERSFNF